MFDPALAGKILAGLFFLAILVVLLSGYIVAWTLGGLSMIFALIGWWVGAFDPNLLQALSTRFFGVITNPVLIAVPLFVYMGVVLERSKIAEVLLTTMGELFGSLRGGLGISVVVVGALLAASTGVVGATVVAMGLLALPAMLRAGYDPKLATGVICAAGTLGQILPPSTVLIFTADILQGANAAAQAELGNFAPDTVSVGDLFVGAFIPGMILAVLYALWVMVRAIIDPKSAPAIVMTAEQKATLGRRVVVALIPPLALIVAVLGSIVGGVATPTESASVGSLGAILLCLIKLLAAMVPVMASSKVRTRFLATMNDTCRSTMTITSMIFIILRGATAFALVFTRMGGYDLVQDFLAAMPGGQVGAVMAVMAMMFVLGFFLDTFEIVFVVVPITAPVLIILGVDPILLGVLIGLILQTSFLTPPFGFALFYLRGVAPAEVKTTMLYRGVIPFVVMQIAVLVLVWQWQALATYLPNYFFRQPAATTIDGAPAAPAPLPFDDSEGDEFL